MLAMAKMSAARKRHPDITVSLSMSVRKGAAPGGGRALTYGPSSRPITRAGARRVEIIAIDSQQRQLALVSVAAPSPLRSSVSARTPGLVTSPVMLACCCTFTKTLSKFLASNLFCQGCQGSGVLPTFHAPGSFFFFGVTRSTSAAHDCASRNASRPPRFRSRQATQRAEGLA